MSGIQFGIDRLLASPELVTGRVGLVTNDAARTARDSELHSRVALQLAGRNLVRLFSPEHGIAASAADGAAVADGVDPFTGLPVVSLYGEHMRPPRESLGDLDAVLFDIPDIGARFYTYIWTLAHVLEACAEAGVPLIVLDRPNPLSGDLAAAEGPMLDVEKFSSFIGRAAIPIRHSLTVGELAQLWNAEWNLNAKLEVIRCEGWQRAMHWPDTGLPFVQTSPAIASYEAALLYPGLCLFEATNLSVGRGTPLAFQAVSAPWLNTVEIAARFNALALNQTASSPHPSPPFRMEERVAAGRERRRSEIPRQKAQTEIGQGLPPTGVLARPENPNQLNSAATVRLVVNDPKVFRPVAAGLLLLATVLELHRDHFQWAKYPTAANPGGEGHFERLIGRTGTREALERGVVEVHPLVAGWTEAVGWPRRVKPFLLYD